MKKVVVVDVSGPLRQHNRLFDRSMVGNSRYAWATCYLYEECRKNGIELVTSDIYLSSRKDGAKAILWRNAVAGGDAKRVIAAGARPAILMAYEHPLHACFFYWNLRMHSAAYDHTLMPKGAEPFASRKTKFRAVVPPQPYPQSTRAASNFGTKKFLAMISGNTRIHPLKRLYVAIANTVKPLPTLLNRELYRDRLHAIVHFSRRRDFDLYGRGWDKPVRFTFGGKRREYKNAVLKSWRGEADDKYPLLQQYKFSICFENCVFSGWVTEKIIDSLLAGCVPIYWGAPDIEEFIPKNCFIDFREFASYAELESFLEGMDEKTYGTYIENINRFIASNQYREFTQEKFAEDMIALFNSYF